MMSFVFDRIEKNVGKGENTSVFTFSHDFFQKAFFPGLWKVLCGSIPFTDLLLK